MSPDPFHKGANFFQVTHLLKPSFFFLFPGLGGRVEGWPRCALVFVVTCYDKPGSKMSSSLAASWKGPGSPAPVQCLLCNCWSCNDVESLCLRSRLPAMLKYDRI